jgi:hypothetical protein
MAEVVEHLPIKSKRRPVVLGSELLVLSNLSASPSPQLWFLQQIFLVRLFVPRTFGFYKVFPKL